jgi:hypothetical protein
MSGLFYVQWRFLDKERLSVRFLRFLLKPRPAQLGVLSMLFVGGVALFEYVSLGLATLFCTGGVIRGANIETAVGVAFFGGLAGAVVIAVAARFSGYLLAVALFLGAAVLVAALALVAADSATYIQDNGYCGFFTDETGSSTYNFGYLYALWGVPLVVLVFAAGWALRNPRRLSSSKPRLRKDVYGLLHPKPDDQDSPG